MTNQRVKSSLNNTAQSVKRAAALLMVSIFLSRVIGFFREWILARTVGATLETDVYYASFTIPDFLNYLMAAGALSISFIPILNDYRTRDKEVVSQELFRAIASVFGGILLVLVILCEIWARDLARVIAPGFTPHQLDTLTHLLRIILPAQLCFFWGGLGTGVLHVHGRFWLSALSPIIYNAAIITFGWLFHESLGVAAFSWGILVGAVVGHGFLISWGVIQCGYSLKPLFKFNPEVREGLSHYVKLSMPIMMGFSLVVTDEWITKFLASQLEPKLLSWLSYARTEMRIPIAIIGQAAGIASFPYLSRLWSERNYSEYGRALKVEFQRMWALATLCAVIVYLLATPITVFIYGGGRLTQIDIEGIASALRIYAWGIFFWTAQILVSRGFYASQRTWLPSVVGTILSLGFIPLYMLLQNRFSYLGLAASSSLGIALYTLVLWWFLRRHLRKHCPDVLFGDLYRFCAAWLGMIIPAWLVCEGIHQLRLYHGTQVSALIEIIFAMLIIVPGAYWAQRKIFVKWTGEPMF